MLFKCMVRIDKIFRFDGGNNKSKTISYGLGIRYAMATGFALLSISPLHEKTVYDRLKTIKEVTEIHPLFGEYDILVKIECSDMDSIGDVVINNTYDSGGSD